MIDQRPFRTPLKLFASLFAIGGVIWLGASVARMVLGFDAFVPGTTTLKATQSEAAHLHTIWLYTLLGGWAGWSFAVAAFGALGSAILSASIWKREGWIVMNMILFVVLLPAQVWVILQDVDLWQLFNAGTGLPLASADEVLSVFLQRTTDITSSVINGFSLLIGATILLFAVWQPLRKPEPPAPTTEEE